MGENARQARSKGSRTSKDLENTKDLTKMNVVVLHVAFRPFPKGKAGAPDGHPAETDGGTSSNCSRGAASRPWRLKRG